MTEKIEQLEKSREHEGNCYYYVKLPLYEEKTLSLL